MKVRTGFVSNSSSSSFIVIKPTATEHKFNSDIEYIEDYLIKTYGYEKEDLRAKWISEKIDVIISNINGLNGFFELIYCNAEYGSEESIMDLLNNLNLKFISFGD